MKHKYSIFFILLIMVMIVSPTKSFSLKNTIIGLWKFERQLDGRNKDIPLSHYITYDFYEDGDVIIKDMKWREQSTLRWTLSGSRLTIYYISGAKWMYGKINFINKNTFIYKLPVKDKIISMVFKRM